MNFTPKKRQGGRPRAEVSAVRHKTIGVRVNLQEWNTLRQKAADMGMAPARLLRVLALQKRLPSPPVPAVNREMYAELMRLAVNFNQLVRLVHKNKFNISMTLLHRVIRETNAIQREIMGLHGQDNTSEDEPS